MQLVYLNIMHKITNLCKFELDWSSELQEKHPGHTKLCAFRCLILRPQILNLRSRNQIHGLLLSRTLRNFRGSRFSLCLYYQQLPITCYQQKSVQPSMTQLNFIRNYSFSFELFIMYKFHFTYALKALTLDHLFIQLVSF